MKPTRAGQWLDARKRNLLSSFATYSGLEEFVAPFSLSQRFARASDRGIGLRLLLLWLDLFERSDRGSWNCFDCERSSYTQLRAIDQWLIVKRFVRCWFIVGNRA